MTNGINRPPIQAVRCHGRGGRARAEFIGSSFMSQMQQRFIALSKS